jgi:hypothetical protein
VNQSFPQDCWISARDFFRKVEVFAGPARQILPRREILAG